MTATVEARWTPSLAARYQTMVYDLGAEAHVEVRAYQSFDDLLEVIGAGETVVIGGAGLAGR